MFLLPSLDFSIKKFQIMTIKKTKIDAINRNTTPNSVTSSRSHSHPRSSSQVSKNNKNSLISSIDHKNMIKNIINQASKKNSKVLIKYSKKSNLQR